MTTDDLIKVSDDTFIAASEVRKMMIEFARGKVKEALETGANSASYLIHGQTSGIEIDKDSILNSYPLDQIK